MPFILALDQGTTSSRAIVFEHTGAIRALAQQPFRQIYPQPGWVEHDPMEILDTQIACARQVLREAQLSASDIAAIGIANQRETTLIWERSSGRPIHNAIVWQDRRTADWCDAQRAAGLEPAVRRKTGLLLDPYLSAGKIAWLLDHASDAPDARARAARGELAFGTVDTWLLWHLTDGAVHATDVSNASRTLLYDIHRRIWDDELLAAFDIPHALLPEVRASSGNFGSTSAHWFDGPIRIAGIAGDQQAALFGQGCLLAGQAKNTYGTGCFMLMHTGNHAYPSRHGLLTSAAASLGGTTASSASSTAPEYVLEGSVFSAGSAVQWLRDELRIIENSAEIEPLAASVPDTGGVYLVPAFTGLGSPYWDARARGAIVGITRGTSRAHLARAALEAIALQSAELLEAMKNDTGLALMELRVDGGATANNLLMQLQADLIGLPVLRPHVQETTALGAADLAALAVGLWSDAQAIQTARRAHAVDRIFEPQASRDWALAKLNEWKRAVQRSLDWAQSS